MYIQKGEYIQAVSGMSKQIPEAWKWLQTSKTCGGISRRNLLLPAG
jgi:hypothetical protein